MKPQDTGSPLQTDQQASLKICVLGGGPSGLVAAKNLLQRGLAVEILEREDNFGGNWYFGKPASSVLETTHLISSKRMTQFLDFPMPKDYPPYPSQRQALDYLRAYAQHFGLYQHAKFGAEVLSVEPLAVSSERTSATESAPVWQVTLADGTQRQYAGVVVANGHHWNPLWPEIPGEFSGELLHAKQVKSAQQLRGKRVLVIGGGNSGCDLAVEAAQHGQQALLSLRRGYHFLPKFLLGGPLDAGGERFHRWRLPLWLRRWLTSYWVRIAVGSPERYGLPKPDHRLFETHPIVNSQLLYHIGHGKVKVRPAVVEFCGKEVRFADGRQEAVDLVVCATGYQLSFPFLASNLTHTSDGKLNLFQKAFHRQYDNLFFAGCIQPNGAIWPLVDWQTQVMAVLLQRQQKNLADPQLRRFAAEKQCGEDRSSGGIRYDSSPRHQLEVEFFAYRDELQRLLRGLG